MDVECVGRVFKTPKLKGNYNITAYIDNGVIEVFVDNGRYVITNVVYNIINNIECNKVEYIKLYKMEQ